MVHVQAVNDVAHVRTLALHDCAEILDFLLPLSHVYPNFESWFNLKVVPGVMLGTRKVVRLERSGALAAVGIAKDENGEQKLCTIRVAPSHWGRGLGLRTLDELLAWLPNDRPIATVSEENIEAFGRIFERYGFQITSVACGLYRPGKAEFIFNDKLQFVRSRPF